MICQSQDQVHGTIFGNMNWHYALQYELQQQPNVGFQIVTQLKPVCRLPPLSTADRTRYVALPIDSGENMFTQSVLFWVDTNIVEWEALKWPLVFENSPF